MQPDVTAIPVSELYSQLPHGVQDRFLAEALRRRQAEALLREQFSRWGYHEVIPPTYEYYENLSVGAGDDLRRAMVRFFDAEGHTLALRADFTPQVARMAATKLFDQPMPLRCFYAGSLFRHEEPQAGRKREFTQAGIELIGAGTAEADAEAVALSIAALEALSIRDFQVNLGQMAFFRAVTAGLAAARLAPIRDAIDHKNHARLEAALDEAAVTGARHDLLRHLPDLIGGGEVLDLARDLSCDLDEATAALAALDHLAGVYRLLQAHGAGERVILDLGEVRGMDYYTGITFRGVATGLGWPIVSGGRYDDLIAGFGRPLAAVGFGLGVERALLAQARQGTTRPSPAADVLLCGCDHEVCLALAGDLRRAGCRVEIDVLGLDPDDLPDEARRRGIPRALRCTADGYLLSDATASRSLTAADVLAEAATWPTELHPAPPVPRPTPPESRVANHASRMTHHAPRFTHHASHKPNRVSSLHPLTIALPKGRLLEAAAGLFRRLGWPCDLGNGSRHLLVTENRDLDGRALRFLLVKPADVPVYVEYGAADAGVVGQDALWESGRDVYEPLHLGFGRCRLVLAGKPAQRERNLRLATGLRVATQYPRLARAYFQERGLSAEVIPLSGSIELGPLVNLADLLVDVVETGRTLRENGLVELDTIAASQAVLVVNRVSHRLRLAEIRGLMAEIVAVVAAEEWPQSGRQNGGNA
jgi:ATP phosphoribosyltransferase regulatory subunit